jgi:hypothetical protein
MPTIYCDTDTLWHNIKRQEAEPDSQKELVALECLLASRGDDCLMYRSRVDRSELENMRDPQQREGLRRDYESLAPIPRDENPIGFYNQMDHVGTVSMGPIVLDIQDEALYLELCKRGLKHRDAQHLTQAISNSCDVFLTRDNGIIAHRDWLMTQGIRVRRPSELISELGLAVSESKRCE